MKKFFSFLLVGILALSLAGCVGHTDFHKEDVTDSGKIIYEETTGPQRAEKSLRTVSFRGKQLSLPVKYEKFKETFGLSVVGENVARKPAHHYRYHTFYEGDEEYDNVYLIIYLPPNETATPVKMSNGYVIGVEEYCDDGEFIWDQPPFFEFTDGVQIGKAFDAEKFSKDNNLIYKSKNTGAGKRYVFREEDNDLFSFYVETNNAGITKIVKVKNKLL